VCVYVYVCVRTGADGGDKGVARVFQEVASVIRASQERWEGVARVWRKRAEGIITHTHTHTYTHTHLALQMPLMWCDE
jgi:hypothetical protein